MNSFEIYKLKAAGMSNLGVNRILALNQRLSLADMAHCAGVRHPSLFLERYHLLNIRELKAEFKVFPSLSIMDESYPQQLRETYNPPTLLFYQGDKTLLSRSMLGFVGSRRATKSGILVTRKLIRELAGRFTIVSGLALGIDKASHVASIKNGHATIGVIGTGLDQYYPKENKALQDYMKQHQLVVSEYGPGTKPKRHHYPERNRLIAGLSLGVVVVEAKLRSGSLITGECAMEAGRDVFAVPGDVISQTSDGCHRLIQDGAKLIYSAQDILSEYQ